jgi:aryl-alcohol dehydrogenase-like predicted oxidoreductase
MSYFMDRAGEQTLLERVQLLRPVAEEVGLSMAQLALAWVLREENVAAAIIGATRPEQVADNAAASGVELDAATLAQIDEILADSVRWDPPASTRD